MSKLIPVNIPNALNDSRCQGWCKVVRAADPLPMPADVDGASSLPYAYVPRRKGEGVEAFPGDYVLLGEANHHRRARGWSYRLFTIDDGKVIEIDHGRDFKERLRAALRDGLDAPAELLLGTGDIAAMIRCIHARRAGFR